MNKKILLSIIPMMLFLIATPAIADTTLWEIGVFDNAYNPSIDGTKITATTPHVRSNAPTGIVPVDYTDPSSFYSVLVPVTTITGSFTEDLSQGATLLVSWTPGRSYPSENFSVTLDGTTMTSRTAAGGVCSSDPSGGICGWVPPYYSGSPGLPYYTEIFDFGVLGSGIHTLTISYPRGDGIGFDYLRLSTPEREYPILESTLKAGQNIDAGTLTVTNDGTDLYVEYQTIDGWEMTETHLAVECSLEEIPQTQPNKKGKGGGNPIPGHFEYSTEYDPAVTEYTEIISLSELGCGNELFIAAHAVVQKVTVITPTPYYASSVFSSDQGTRKDGTPVRVGRSVPEQGLAYETGKDEQNFFSLGFGGWIIVEFDCPIINGEGDDVRIIEDTWGSYPLEKAEVWASQDNDTWTFLGVADNTFRDPVYNIHTIALFDLGSLEWAKFIKVVDISDPAVHSGTADGYDLNAVESLQDCVEVQEETAWGDEVGIPFPGSNWAMYLTYEVEEPGPVLVETIDIYANDSNPTYSTILLESEVQYELEAVGTAFAGGKYTEDIEFDAKYSITHSKVSDDWTDSVTDYESYGPTLLDLFVDGSSVDWGAYNNEHTYYWTVTGTGVPLELLIYDIYYPNNTGFITVNIYELP